MPCSQGRRAHHSFLIHVHLMWRDPLVGAFNVAWPLSRLSVTRVDVSNRPSLLACC